MTAPQKTQQAAERVRCSYLHQTNGQKQLAPAVELGKAEEAEKSDPEVGPTVSINLGSLKHWTTKRTACTS